MINDIKHPLAVKALENYFLWLKYPDGIEGIVDLSDLNGKGPFRFWDDYSNFKLAHIHPITKAITWNDNIDICSDALYQEIISRKH
jgi:hypothetical protein